MTVKRWTRTRRELEPDHKSAAKIVIVLPRFAGIDVKWRNTAPVVTSFEAQSELVSHFGNVGVKANASLQDASGFTAVPRVTPKKQQVAAGSEMPEASAKAEPGRKTKVRKKAHARRRSHKK